MESKCQIVSILSDSLVIQLKGANRHELETLVKDTDYRIKLVKWREKRSLDANDYLWKLEELIAFATKSTKAEVHAENLQKYGFRDYECKPMTISADDDPDKICPPMPDGHKYYWEFIKASDDGRFKAYRRIRGTHELDSREFSHYLDFVIEEAKAQGIETLPPQRIEEMKARLREDEINLTK